MTVSADNRTPGVDDEVEAIRLITRAMTHVENTAADTRLTDAVVALDLARRKIREYINRDDT